VTFSSDEKYLVQNDTNNASDVFVRDLQARTTERVSLNSAGVEGNLGGFYSSISGDGRFVAFRSNATNLVPGDANALEDLFVRDRLAGMTSLVSVSSAGTQQNDYSVSPSISLDGRFVAFESQATNLVSNDTNGYRDIFVHGPWLTLEASDSEVAAGATLTFSMWTGDASNLALLALMAIDGIPMFVPASISTFDGNGVWSFSDTVPAGLSGMEMTLQAYGFVPTGKAQASNEVTVAFQ
jgi:hypothetical protein